MAVRRGQRRRPAACLDGDLQCTGRPAAGDCAGRHGAHGHSQSPAVDRLGAYRAGVLKFRPRLRQMGRSAGQCRSGSRFFYSGLSIGDDRAAGAGLHLL